MFSHEPGPPPSHVGPVWPWVRGGPGKGNDGLPKTDFTKLDSAGYFNRLRSRVITAGQKGLYVSVMLFSDIGGSDNSTDGNPFVDGNNVNDVNCAAPCPVTLPLSSAVWGYEKAYIHKVVDTIHDLPNAMYEVVNEPPLASASWVAQVLSEISGYGQSTYGTHHPFRHQLRKRHCGRECLWQSADYISPSSAVPPPATGQCPVPRGNTRETHRQVGAR
jgi:hypothetical protein